MASSRPPKTTSAWCPFVVTAQVEEGDGLYEVLVIGGEASVAVFDRLKAKLAGDGRDAGPVEDELGRANARERV